MKAHRLTLYIGIALVALGTTAAAGCSSSSQPAPASNSTVAQGGGQPTTPGGAQATTPGSAPGSAQVLPVATNPIVNTATQDGLQITGAMAENNVDPATKKDLADRLQFTIKNTGTQPVNNPEVYYQMTDSTTKKTEGYYQKLTGISVAPGAEATVYFDNVSGAGHYPENAYSLYRTSPNEVVIAIEASATGYKPATGQAVKSVGTGEKAGQ
ncbi:MAG: hypothetical protein M1337_07700 [Actinobacteria bacterium]|nr:hypothetical protein [Actinomycetota bacterium]